MSEPEKKNKKNIKMKIKDKKKKKSPKKSRGKKLENKKIYKHNESSDSDDDSEWLPEDTNCEHSDSDEYSEESEYENENLHGANIHKIISQMFPKKSPKEKKKQLEKIDEFVKKEKKSRKKNKKEPEKKTHQMKTRNKKKNKSKKKEKDVSKKEEEKEESEYSDLEEEIDTSKYYYDDDEYGYDDEDYLPDDLSDEELKEMLKQNMKFNIIFTVGDKNGGTYGHGFDMGLGDDPYYDEEEYEDEEDDEYGSFKRAVETERQKIKAESDFIKGESVKVLYKKKWHDGKILKKHKVKVKGVTKPQYRYDVKVWVKENKSKEITMVKTKNLKKISEEENEVNTLNEIKELVSIRKKDGKKAMMKRFEEMCKINDKHNELKKKKDEEKTKKKNITTLRKLLREKNVMNDFKYFKNMELKTQEKILEQLREVKKFSDVEKPYRLALLESDIPVSFKSSALRKINTLLYMDPGSGEYYKIKQWVDGFMRIPFCKNATLPLSLEDGIEKCNDFLEKSKKILDDAVYGLDDAKMQIMQMMGQLISNPESVGSAIAIHGPMGTGKTTLVKEGISKILNRPFAFLALGGATDSSFLEGHSYTYEGSIWGKIVDIVINSKCMNPVFYFDELDKVSDTPKGEEIIGILTHLTDTTQNTTFHDKYFANIDFDLSKALFIFSYNDEKKVNKILKDRMYTIKTKGYDKKEKITIAKNYLLPAIQKLIKFNKEDIIIEDTVLEHIINQYTEDEKGVRNLKRCLEIIHTKINLCRLMKPDTKLFEKEKTMKVEFPFTVTTKIVDILIKINKENNIPFGMYL
tara:strand:- start:8668 stop:11079 length:2412 start_codon:yes stop_codon:yes gene_type:complete